MMILMDTKFADWTDTRNVDLEFYNHLRDIDKETIRILINKNMQYRIKQENLVTPSYRHYLYVLLCDCEHRIGPMWRHVECEQLYEYIKRYDSYRLLEESLPDKGDGKQYNNKKIKV